MSDLKQTSVTKFNTDITRKIIDKLFDYLFLAYTQNTTDELEPLLTTFYKINRLTYYGINAIEKHTDKEV